MYRRGLIPVDREEFSALVGAVKEIAVAVKRMEDRLEHMDGRQARMEDRLEHLDSDLQEFRRESRELLTRIGRRLDHHDRMLMDHDRRIVEVEAAQADS